MKYIDEFRDGGLARGIAAQIAREVRPDRRYHFMEFCGGHTHAISRYGIGDLLPAQIKLIHGPGCPVCVLPIGRVDLAIRLALEHKVRLATYGDCLRVPASDGLSLLKAKARGAKVAMVYSAADALELARRRPDEEVVFFAIGFETTTPPTALVIKQAAAERLKNFSVVCNHVLTPSAITSILESPEVRSLGTVPLDGFIGPAHVSTVIGAAPYEHFAQEYAKPVVIAGFEPLDVMQAILMLVRQVNDGRAEVENEFTRAVTRDGKRPGRGAVQRAGDPRVVRGLRRRAQVRARNAQGAGQQGLRVRRHPARGEAPARLQDLRHGLHARESGRVVHGLQRRRVRRALQLRPLPGACRGRRMTPEAPGERSGGRRAAHDSCVIGRRSPHHRRT